LGEVDGAKGAAADLADEVEITGTQGGCTFGRRFLRGG